MARYEDIQVGQTAEVHHKITWEDVEKFVDLTGDDNKLHIDKEFASKTSFKKPVAHGMLGASFISTLIGTKIPGDGALWFAQSLEFLLPVRVGDEITVVAEVIKKIDRTQTVELTTDIYNQHRQKVLQGTAKAKVIDQEDVEPDVVEVGPAKTALVLGATGGIGRAVVAKLAEAGFQVGIHYNRNKKLASELCSSIKKNGGKAFILQADLLNSTQVMELKQAVSREMNALSVLVNASSLSIPNITFHDIKWEDIQQQLDIHVRSTFESIKTLLPLMEVQNYGKIVTLTTQAIEQPNEQWLHYITAKSALDGFSKALAVELAKKGIRFNMVSPGMTDTELISEIPKKARLLAAAKTPLKRIATPDDVAEAILYLSQTKSDFITGETIRVNGGQVML